MDVLVELAPLAAFVAGVGFTLLAVRWRQKVPRMDVALNDYVGIQATCREHADGAHYYDRVIADGRGWKCRCGARSGKK